MVEGLLLGYNQVSYQKPEDIQGQQAAAQLQLLVVRGLTKPTGFRN